MGIMKKLHIYICTKEAKNYSKLIMFILECQYVNTLVFDLSKNIFIKYQYFYYLVSLQNNFYYRMKNLMERKSIKIKTCEKRTNRFVQGMLRANCSAYCSSRLVFRAIWHATISCKSFSISCETLTSFWCSSMYYKQMHGWCTWLLSALDLVYIIIIANN